jgi:hypothetical protein
LQKRALLFKTEPRAPASGTELAMNRSLAVAALIPK